MPRRPNYDYIDDELDEKQIIKPLNKSALSDMTLLDKLEHLITVARRCKLKNEFFELHSDLINSTAEALHLTPVQTVMLCPYVSSPTSGIDDRDIQEYFDCSAISIMRHREDIDILIHRRYITRQDRFRNGCECMRLSEKAKKALCNNQGLPAVKTAGLTPAEFMSSLRNLIFENDRLEIIDNEELIYETMDLVKQNPQLQIVKALNDMEVCESHKFVILFMCKLLVIDGRDSMPLDQVGDFVNEYYVFSDAILNGTHPFIQDDLIKPSDNDRLMSRDVFCLTDKARKLFLSDYELPKRSRDIKRLTNANLIKSRDIKYKALFYSDEDQEQIDTLQGLLEERQLKAIRSRLKDANMRKGFNCLFYGLPGTGKTETALQLARFTKRDIMQVDISVMRDKWYGETEKIVKGIFADYAKLVEKSSRIPILLINEADALLSVRTSLASSNPTIEKTENAIQNILLESMENLDGILIATTNLTCNLDSAFERRFLYKVEFHQPSVEAKTSIWENFLPALNHEDAVRLARGFDFSGGQIENITRKVIVDQLLYGKDLSVEHIEKLCSQETMSNKRGNNRPIGFH